MNRPEELHSTVAAMSRAAGGLILVVGAAAALYFTFRQGNTLTTTTTVVSDGENKFQKGVSALGFLTDMFGKRGASNNENTSANTVLAPSEPRGGKIGFQLKSDLMRDFGLTNSQAAGVVGNLHHESGGFKSLQEISPLIPGSRGGWGYAQWTGSRRLDFEGWVASRGLDARSYAANYGFLAHELKNTSERRVLPKLRAAKSVEQSSDIFMRTFLRPGIPHASSRVRAARRYL